MKTLNVMNLFKTLLIIGSLLFSTSAWATEDGENQNLARIQFECAQDYYNDFRFVVTQLSEETFVHDTQEENYSDGSSRGYFLIEVFPKDSTENTNPTMILEGEGTRVATSFRIYARNAAGEELVLHYRGSQPEGSFGSLNGQTQTYSCAPYTRIEEPEVTVDGDGQELVEAQP